MAKRAKYGQCSEFLIKPKAFNLKEYLFSLILYSLLSLELEVSKCSLYIYDGGSKQDSKCHLNVLTWQNKQLANLG